MCVINQPSFPLCDSNVRVASREAAFCSFEGEKERQGDSERSRYKIPMELSRRKKKREIFDFFSLQQSCRQMIHLTADNASDSCRSIRRESRPSASVYKDQVMRRRHRESE